MNRALKMKTTGAILTGVGGGLFLIGEGLLWTGVVQNLSTWGDQTGDRFAIPGSIITATSLALLIPGIVMLVKGSKRYKRLRATRE